MTITFSIMFIMSFLSDGFSKHRFFYGFEVIATGAILLISRRILENRPRMTLLFVYLYTSLMYYYGIYIGVISQHDNLAVTSCLFLGILPLLFIDDITRIMMFASIAAILNIFMMITMESDNVLMTDLVDVIFSWFTGIYLSIIINRIKIKSYVNERTMAIERDTDAMTGLWNKNCLTQKITDHISKQDARGIFYMMDIDHFKQLNDSFGHSFGDEILIETTNCVRKVFDADNVLGRFGRDEFIFYVPDASEAKASWYAENLLSTLYETIKLPTEDKGLHISLGIAIYSYVPDMTYDKLMNMADRALYVTKKGGRFGYTIFSEEKMERKAIKVN